VAQKRRRNPLTIRLPDDERAELEDRAHRAGLSVSGYFRTAVLEVPRPRVQRRSPTADERLLSQIMVRLGKVGSNANQLAHHANLGDWPDRPAIEEMRRDIREMRDLLFWAFGKTPPGD
jgi:mobilization protein NikA